MKAASSRREEKEDNELYLHYTTKWDKKGVVAKTIEER